jgi:hypothetical protein
MDKAGMVDDDVVSLRLFLSPDDSIKYDLIWDVNIILLWAKHSTIKTLRRTVPGKIYWIGMASSNDHVYIVTVSSLKTRTGQGYSVVLVVVAAASTVMETTTTNIRWTSLVLYQTTFKP